MIVCLFLLVDEFMLKLGIRFVVVRDSVELS